MFYILYEEKRINLVYGKNGLEKHTNTWLIKKKNSKTRMECYKNYILYPVETSSPHPKCHPRHGRDR